MDKALTVAAYHNGVVSCYVAGADNCRAAFGKIFLAFYGKTVLDFIKKSQNVSTFVGKGNVTLYKLSGTKFTPVMNRALAEQTDWYSDQYVKLDGMTYFRVATNEWVKISNVYRYKDLNTIVNTKNQTSRLLNDEGVLVMNRALGPRTSWLVDRIGYLGDDDNPTGFYRVATNEFLNTSDTLQ